MTVAPARTAATTPARGAAAVCLAVLTASLLAACGGPAPPPVAVGRGDPERGSRLIESFGCGACRTISGIPGADGLVGPPLLSWGRRAYIAGALPNNEENLVRWVTDPQGVEPGTAMPEMGVEELEARDIAADLLSLD